MSLSRPDLTALVRSWPARRVLVVGDVVLDEWLNGHCERVAREAPVPTVLLSSRDQRLGGAGNVAANLDALGAQVVLVTATGHDEASGQVAAMVQDTAVQWRPVPVAGWRTVVKRRLVADGQVVARFDDPPTVAVPPLTGQALAGQVLQAVSDGVDAVVVADYGLGTCAGPAVRGMLRRLAMAGVPVVVDARDLGRWADMPVTVVTPNWEEACGLLGLAGGEGPDRVRLVRQQVAALLEAVAADVVVVTLDEDGAVLVRRQDGRATHHPVPRVGQAHSAGAGDAFAAAFALALASGAALADAADVANLAAGVVVRQPGTAVCSGSGLLRGRSDGLTDMTALTSLLTEARAAGRRVAFTNGCFDLLHPGHVRVLDAAAALADVVVVGVNDDAGVRRLKGSGRPVVPLPDRAAVLAAMDGVDAVVAFSDPAPLALVEVVRPDVYVKGGDHDVEQLAEAQLTRALGGAVHVVPIVADRSTSSLIAACADVPAHSGLVVRNGPDVTVGAHR